MREFFQVLVEYPKTAFLLGMLIIALAHIIKGDD